MDAASENTHKEEREMMRLFQRFPVFAVTLGLIFVLVLAGCGSSGSGSSGNGTSSPKLTIAFLMPCSTCADRFEQQDKPDFIAAVHAIDPTINVIANNAQGDTSTQISQAEAALTNGANAIVISPLDEATGAAIVAKASAQNVPVLSYDGLITGAKADFYVSFDNERVGELQAQYLADHVKAGGAIVMINGSQDIAPGRQFKAGAHKILDPLFQSGKLKLGFEGDAQQFLPANGQRLMEQALTKLNDQVDGVLVANDGLAGAVITALTERHLNGKVLVTGQDASDAGLQRILVGDQSMTVYKAIKQEATTAAKVAVAWAKGQTAQVKSLATTTVNNGTTNVPSVLLTPVVVTADNIFSTVIADGFTTKARICTGAAASKCP
jgi:D-xylose transport system substrate-binding protein